MLSKLPHVGTTIFARMSALAQEVGALNLSQGFPDFDPPSALAQALGEHALAGHNQYAPMAGLPRLRDAIAEQLRRWRGVEADPEAEITVVPGATEGIFCAITAVVSPGDEVIVLDPVYDSYEPAVELAGGRCVHVPMSNSDFSIDWNRVRAAVTPRTRLLMLNSPHNPTGAVIGAHDLDALEELIDDHGFYICSDEVYEHLVFDGAAHQSVLQRPALRERSFVHYSFGKTFSVTGWKTGYCVAPPALTVELRKVHQYVAFVAVTPVQHALADFITAEPEYAAGLAKDYERRRDRFLTALAGSRFSWKATAGSYFQVLEYQEISDRPDVEVCENWTREHGVASIPLSVFHAGQSEARHLRFCFAKSNAVLDEAARRLCAI